MNEIGKVFGEVTDVDISGTIYKVSPFTLNEINDITNHFKNKREDEVINLYKKTGQTVNIKELTEILKDDADFADSISSIDGVIFVLYKLLSKHQKVKIQDLNSIVTLQNLKDINEVILKMMYGTQEEVKEEEVKND